MKGRTLVKSIEKLAPGYRRSRPRRSVKKAPPGLKSQEAIPYGLSVHCEFVTKYIYLLVQYSLFITTLKSKCYYRIILLLRVLVLNVTCIYGDI